MVDLRLVRQSLTYGLQKQNMSKLVIPKEVKYILKNSWVEGEKKSEKDIFH